jgi:polysaccharide export outer membrane protein
MVAAKHPGACAGGDRTRPADPVRKPALRFLALVAAVGLAACGLPAQGPSTQDVITRSAEQEYELVALTRAVAGRFPAQAWPGFPLEFLGASLTSTGHRLGVGDRVSVTIFEAGPDGLFSTSNGSSSVTMANIQIGPDGAISLPYAGQIPVNGLTPTEVERAIVAALAGSAVEPQALVTVTHQANNTVTVVGDVARPALVPLNLRGDRLSTVLAAAGGSRFPAHETRVAVTRGGRAATASLQRILDDPAQDIALRSGDTITFTRQPTGYTIMGSVNQPATVPFASARTTLMDALGRASGLSDERADAGGVFLFRRESPALLVRHGLAAKPWWGGEGNAIPTVYQLDFSQPEAFFIAQGVLLRDGDLIYIATAEAVQLTRALRLFNLAAGSAQATLDLAQ